MVSRFALHHHSLPSILSIRNHNHSLLSILQSRLSSTFDVHDVHPMELPGFSDLPHDTKTFILKERERDKVERERAETERERAEKERALRKELKAELTYYKLMQFHSLAPMGKLATRSIIESLEALKLTHSNKLRQRGSREETWTIILDQNEDMAEQLKACDPSLTNPQIAKEISELYRLWSDDLHKYIVHNDQATIFLPKNVSTPLRRCLARVLIETYGYQVEYDTLPKSSTSE